jgi:hypothetical protein
MKRNSQFMLDLGEGTTAKVTLRSFDGLTYDAHDDRERLSGQYERVWNVMADGHWRTLAQISEATGDPQASISARLRDFRKPRNGGHRLDARRMEGGHGLYMYRLLLAESLEMAI